MSLTKLTGLSNNAAEGYQLAEQIDALLNQAIMEKGLSQAATFWQIVIRTTRTSLDLIEGEVKKGSK